MEPEACFRLGCSLVHTTIPIQPSRLVDLLRRWPPPDLAPFKEKCQPGLLYSKEKASKLRRWHQVARTNQEVFSALEPANVLPSF